jgi:diguanylate cyclase (GGDEF)-like protein
VLNLAPVSLRNVLESRRKQLGYRLAITLILTASYAPVLGWTAILLIAGFYVSLQLFEMRCFSGASPWLSAQSRGGALVALALLVLSSGVFGASSLLLPSKLGSWGDAGAAYLLCGAILSSVLTTVGCRAAFYASVLPYFVYVGFLPVNALDMVHAPSFWVVVSMISGGIFLIINISLLWSRSSRNKAVETIATRRYIAERDVNEQRLLQLTQCDPLTGLPNRELLHARLAETLHQQAAGTLMMIDLDGFKYVNDTLGHSAGDRMLREIADRICRVATGVYTAARLGGDEFALLLPGINDPAHALAIANGLIAELSQPVALDGQQINIGASMGIAIHPLHGSDPEQLFANADLALYQAKAEGRHCARLYAPGLRAVAQGKMLRDTELRLAVERGEFEMFYQPQIRLSDRALVGAEALLRWRHPEYGLLTPADFLAALEGGLLSARVGAWVIETACRQAALWRAQGAADFRIGVNIFGEQFRSGNLVAWVMQACATAGLPPHALEIEITENTILRHEDEIIAPLQELRALGVGVAFDDYGTGYASLSMLTRFPVSRLKIDRSFTRSICECSSAAAIIHAVIELARALNLQVTAEGIETQAQAEALSHEHCDEGQGYYFGKPMSAPDFAGSFNLGPDCERAPLTQAAFTQVAL